jgi:hypothetical protein
MIRQVRCRDGRRDVNAPSARPKDGYMLIPRHCRLPSRVLSGLTIGSLLIGATLHAESGPGRMVRGRTARTASKAAPASYQADDLQGATGATTAGPVPENPGGTQLPPGICPASRGPLTMRPVPCGDGYGKIVCHLSFSGDCYGENWRLQNWNRPGCSDSFHRHTHQHSLWKERFCNGLFGKLPQGYVHDTSGFPLKSFFVAQPSDPNITWAPEPVAFVYDYPRYVFQPSLSSGPCPLPTGTQAGEPAPLMTTPMP